nr:hypothetical protein [Tanacetum cinerariifolium]
VTSPAADEGSGVTEVSTSSGSIPTAGPFAAEVRTDSDVVPVGLNLLLILVIFLQLAFGVDVVEEIKEKHQVC